MISLRFVVPAILATLATLLIALSYMVFAAAAVEEARSDEKDRARLLMHRLQGGVEYGFRRGEMPRVQEVVASTGADEGLLIAVAIDHDGTVIASARRLHLGQSADTVLSFADAQATVLLAQLEQHIAQSRLGKVVLSDDGRLLGAVYPLSLVSQATSGAQQQEGTLIYMKDLSGHIGRAIEAVQMQSVAIGAGVLILVLLLALLFHFVITQRIARIVRVSKQVASGDLTARAEFTGRDEIARLGRSVNDMLDRRAKVERVLAQSQKLESIGTLASGIAHDFNNILQAIGGYAGLARADLKKQPEEVTHYLEEIDRACTRAGQLVQRILTVARGGNSRPEAIDLRAVLDDSVGLLRSSIPSNVLLRLEVEPDLPPVLVEPTQIQQIVTNLVINSVQAMEPEGGRLFISAKAHKIEQPHQTLAGQVSAGSYVMLSVLDTGRGIPAGIMTKVLDPFFTTKETSKGTGLGLSIIHGAVAQAGGGLEIDSVPGEGTQVRIWLPLADGQVAKPRVALESDLLSKGQGDRHMRVLLVDDEWDIVRTTQVALERCGMAVHVASSPSAALIAVEHGAVRPEVAVIDYTMPEMSGLELASRLNEINPDLPVIICTGHLSRPAFSRMKTPNVRRLIHKPYAIDELTKAIDACVPTRGTCSTL